jgi:hypothetical protein
MNNRRIKCEDIDSSHVAQVSIQRSGFCGNVNETQK